MLTPPPRDRGNIALFGWLLVRFPLLGGSVDIGQSSRASAPATPRPGETSRLTPLVKTNLLCLACLMLGPPLAHAESVRLPTATPGGTIELRELELSAPEVAVDAYLLNFRERTWGVRLESRTAFMSATLAIDLPLKALVWEDPEGKVSVTYNSAEYLQGTLFARHGLPARQDRPAGDPADRRTPPRDRRRACRHSAGRAGGRGGASAGRRHSLLGAQGAELQRVRRARAQPHALPAGCAPHSDTEKRGGWERGRLFRESRDAP